uniref:Uncharacterized protein n=1 Tax=Pseudochlorodesmis sp. HV01306c TaxID=2358490 RepID=A0A386AYH2_9CHLO|nr:hypothetical protein [Pseudochlorodesmis sp. HV01306c]
MLNLKKKINEINELVNLVKVTSATSIDVPKKQLEIFNYCFQSYSGLCNLTKTQLDLMYHFQYLHIFHYQRYVGLNKLCNLVPDKKIQNYLKPTPTFLRNAFLEYPNMTFREWQELSKWPKLQTAKIYYALNQEELAMAEINGHVSDRLLNEREKEVCVQYIQNEAANALNALEMPTRSPEESETKNALGEWVSNEPEMPTRSPEESETNDKRYYSVSVDPRPPASSSPSPTTKWLLFGGVLLGVIAGIAVLVRTQTKFKIKKIINVTTKTYKI